MPKILPNTISCTLTAVGFTDTINRPMAKKVVKIKPITASSFSCVMARIHKIDSAAKMPDTNAPAE